MPCRMSYRYSYLSDCTASRNPSLVRSTARRGNSVAAFQYSPDNKKSGYGEVETPQLEDGVQCEWSRFVGFINYLERRLSLVVCPHR